MCNSIQQQLSRVEDIDLQISQLMAPIKDQLNKLEEERKLENEKLEMVILDEAREALETKDYNCGTANIEAEGVKIKVEVCKNVKYDQDRMRDVEALIRIAGKNPEDYITYKRGVSEDVFKGFPEEIQKAFLTARTVTPSKPKITFERKS